MDMAWMETDYSKHTYFRWKVKWRLEHLGALGTMGETPKQPIQRLLTISEVWLKCQLESRYALYSGLLV